MPVLLQPFESCHLLVMRSWMNPFRQPLYLGFLSCKTWIIAGPPSSVVVRTTSKVLSLSTNDIRRAEPGRDMGMPVSVVCPPRHSTVSRTPSHSWVYLISQMSKPCPWEDGLECSCWEMAAPVFQDAGAQNSRNAVAYVQGLWITRIKVNLYHCCYNCRNKVLHYWIPPWQWSALSWDIVSDFTCYDIKIGNIWWALTMSQALGKFLICKISFSPQTTSRLRNHLPQFPHLYNRDCSHLSPRAPGKLKMRLRTEQGGQAASQETSLRMKAKN